MAEPISHNNSLIILDHPCICWNHLESNLDIFWKLLDTFGIFWDILEICWRSIIRVSSVIISYIQQICRILTFQYLTTATFSGLQTTEVFIYKWHFSCYNICSMCLPFLSPHCVSPVCLTFLGSKSLSQPSWKRARSWFCTKKAPQ